MGRVGHGVGVGRGSAVLLDLADDGVDDSGMGHEAIAFFVGCVGLGLGALGGVKPDYGYLDHVLGVSLAAVLAGGEGVGAGASVALVAAGDQVVVDDFEVGDLLEAEGDGVFHVCMCLG